MQFHLDGPSGELTAEQPFADGARVRYRIEHSDIRRMAYLDAVIRDSYLEQRVVYQFEQEIPQILVAFDRGFGVNVQLIGHFDGYDVELRGGIFILRYRQAVVRFRILYIRPEPYVGVPRQRDERKLERLILLVVGHSLEQPFGFVWFENAQVRTLRNPFLELGYY